MISGPRFQTQANEFILMSSRPAKNCNDLTFPHVLEPSKLFLYGYSRAKILDLDRQILDSFFLPSREREIEFATRGEFYGICEGFNCTRKIERRKDFNCFGNDVFGFIFYVYVCEPDRFWIKTEFLSDGENIEIRLKNIHNFETLKNVTPRENFWSS